MPLSLQNSTCLFVVCGYALVHGLFTSWRAEDNSQELVLSYHPVVLRNSVHEAEQQAALPTELPPRTDILSFSHHHPFLRRSLSVYPGLVLNFWKSSSLNLPSSGIAGMYHHTCIATSNLLLVKSTKSRVGQFLETATNMHKCGNVSVFIVHTRSKSQVWGKYIGQTA